MKATSTNRILSRHPEPDGGYRYRLGDGRSIIIADGRLDGDGWTWAVLDTVGEFAQTGGGHRNEREAKHAAFRAVRL